MLIAGLVGLALTHLFTAQQIDGGAWRIAFVFGLLIGPVGWYIRRSVPETASFEQTRHEVPLPFGAALLAYRGRILIAIGIMVFWTIATYVSNYFGGFTPLAVTALIGFSDDELVVGFYLSAAALISAVFVVLSSKSVAEEVT